MKLTVYAPCYNEIFYAKAWLANVRKLNPTRIIVADTGSTDGSREFFESQSDVLVIGRFQTPRRFDWNESELRNFVIENAAVDGAILALDLDELVGDEFISVLTDFERSEALIGRLVEYKFWGDMRHLRKRSLKPLIRNGKIGWLSNWRGAYPNKRPQLFKKHLDVRYKGNIHPILQYKDYGRFSFYLPWITKNYTCGVYHYHFAGTTTKLGEDRYLDRQDKVKLIEFKGQHPKEIELFGTI